MITQNESGVSASVYEQIRDGGGQVARRLFLQRRNLLFGDVLATGYDETPYYDAEVDITNELVHLAFVSSGSLYVMTYDPSTEEWGSAQEVASDAGSVAPSFGGANYLWYVNTDGDLYRIVTTDEWASAWTPTLVVDVSEEDINTISHIASGYSSVCYIADYRTDYNTHFWTTTSLGSLTQSKIYWPHYITGMSSRRVTHSDSNYDYDVVTITSRLPYQFGLEAKGTEVTAVPFERSGVVAFHVRNTVWSDHYPVEEFDDSSAYQTRKYCRTQKLLGDNRDMLAVTCWGSDGDGDYAHSATRLYLSVDGRHWELEQLYQLDSLQYGAVTILLGDYVYMVSAYGIYVSDATEIVDHISPDIQLEITDRVVDYNTSHSGIRSTNVRLKNNDDWWQDTLLGQGGEFSILTKLGTWWNNDEYLIPVAHDIVDVVRPSRELPGEDIEILARDYGSLMADRKRSPNSRTDDTQLLGADNFWDNTGTGFGGLRHTAGWEGSWSTNDGILSLRSNNKEGLAISTFGLRIWNGSIQSAVAYATADNEEFVGLAFRAYDKDNYFRAIYSEPTDRLVIQEIRGGENVWSYTQMGAGALGWGPNETHWIKVTFRYNYVSVYYSDDGREWVLGFNAIIPGKPPAVLMGFVQVPLEAGATGYVGEGYSEEDSWNWDEPDPYDYGYEYFNPALIAKDLNNIAQITSGGKIAITSNFKSAYPAWAAYSTSISGLVIQFVVDARSPGYLGTGTSINGWVFTETGIYHVEDIFGARTVTLQLTYPVSTRYQSADFAFGDEPHGVVSLYDNTYGNHVYYTTDGVNWTGASITHYNGGTNPDRTPGCHVSTKRPGYVYTSAYHENRHPDLYFSSNYGASWSRSNGVDAPSIHAYVDYGNINAILCGELHVPYHDNDDEMIIFFDGGKADAGHAAWLVGDGAADSLWPTPYGLIGSRWKLVTSPTNRLKAAGIKAKFVSGNTESYLSVSTDGGHEWSDSLHSFTTALADYKIGRVAIAGDDDDTLYVFCDYGGAIYFSDDFGQTLQNKTGNLSSLIPSEWGVGICGGQS